MENAAKALTIAGTILITVVVISALLYMYNDLTSVKRQENENKKTAEVQQFNKSYESYEKTIYGIQLLSLAEKMKEYNQSLGSETGIEGTGKGKENYSYMELIVTDKQNQSHKIKYYIDVQDEVNKLEKIYSSLQTLESLYKAIITKEESNENSNENAKAMYTIEKINGELKIKKSDSDIKKDYNNEKYTIYKNLKTEKYTCTNIEYSKDNGRIIKMEYKYK